MTRKYLLTVSVLAISATGLNFEAYAQDATEPQTKKALETITVTAQRVEQNLQDVPISILAVDGENLESRNIDDFEQLQHIAPGTNFNLGINARQSGTSIRGIGTSLFNLGVEGSVAIAIDGVIIGREGAGTFDLSDVERIEILRGPQGTLFGKNASAGVISIVTKNPTDEFEAKLSAAYGSFNEVNLSGAVSGPITKNISGRLSGYKNTRDGYIKNINPNAPQKELNDRDEYGLKGKLNIDLSSTANILLAADYSKRDQNSTAFTLRSASAGGLGQGRLGFGIPNVGISSAAAGIRPGPDNLSIASEGLFRTDMETFGAQVEANFQFGDFDLVSLTSAREWNSFDINDADLTPNLFLSNNSSDIKQNQFSQEFRLNYRSDSPLSYTVGAFMFSQSIDESATQAGSGVLDDLGVVIPVPFPPFSVPLPNGTFIGTDLGVSFEEQNIAVFGQGEYALTDKLNLIAGFRVVNSDVETSMTRQVTDGALLPFVGQTITDMPLSVSDEDTAIVWRGGLQYHINDDINVFASATRGYKAVGLVTGFATEPTEVGGTTLPISRAEIPTQYEVGIRSSLLGGLVRTNLTSFYTEVEDFQAETRTAGPSGTTVTSVSNAEQITTYGIEGDITLVAAEGLYLNSAFAYTHASFDSFSQAPCYTGQAVGPNACIDTNGDFIGDFQDLSGKRAYNTPDWIISASALYEFDINSDIQGYLQAGAQYRSDTLTFSTGDPNTRIDAYTLVDAQLGIKLWDGQAELSVFGRNLTDETYVSAIFDMPFDVGGYGQFRPLDSLRTFGAKLTLRY